MQTSVPRSPSVLSVLPASLFLILVGWGGLAIVIAMFPPLVWPRWVFFFCLVLALTGTAMPFTAFLNRRFPSSPPADAGVVVRQALWVGLYFSVLAWLQIPRLLTAAMAVLLAAGLILVEWLLRLREMSLWRPES